jgi:hypothetical protein
VPPTWARVGPGSTASTNQTVPATSTSPRRAARRRRGGRCSATGGGLDAVPPPGSGAMPSRRKRRFIGYRRARAVEVEVAWASGAGASCRRATVTAVGDSIGVHQQQREDSRLIRLPTSTSRPPTEAPTGPSITQCILPPDAPRLAPRGRGCSTVFLRGLCRTRGGAAPATGRRTPGLGAHPRTHIGLISTPRHALRHRAVTSGEMFERPVPAFLPGQDHFTAASRHC